MADQSERGVYFRSGLQRLMRRLGAQAGLLIAAALLLIVLHLTASVTAPIAVGGFALLVLVALATGSAESRMAAPEAPRTPLQRPVQWHDVLAALPDPVVVVRRDGRVIAANEAAQRLAPALRAEDSLALAIRTPEVVAALRAAAATGAPQHASFVDRVPTERWFEVFVIPAGPNEDRSADLVATFHDLTPIHRVEQMRADFVANASHELRTPLAAVLGFIDTLQGPARDDAAARDRFLAIMHSQASRMARLIDDLLSLSRIELSAHRRPDKPVELAALVNQVIDGLEPLARDRGVTLQRVLPDAPVTVAGSRDELVRALENLVENAVKYGAAGGRVEIGLGVAPEDGADPAGPARAMLSVRDYGPGIAAEHLPRLTERFYRVDVADSRAQGGTGLGLALVKHIVARHGGQLSIDSAAGRGATFTVSLPTIKT